MVFDDLFDTVFSDHENDEALDIVCNQLFDSSRDCYAEEEHDADGNLVYQPPPLDKVCLSEPERRERKIQLEKQRRLREERERAKWIDKIPVTSPDSDEHDDVPNLLPLLSDDDSVSSSDESSVGSPLDSGGEENDFAPSSAENLAPPPPPAPNLEAEGVGLASEGADPLQPDNRRWHQEGGRLRCQQYACSFGAQQVPTASVCQSREQMKYRQRKQRQQEIGYRMLNAMKMEVPTVEALRSSPLARFITFAASECGYSKLLTS